MGNNGHHKTLRDTPIGEGEYVVQPGDCLSSVAYEHGHFWQTILDDPANSDLRRVRSNHNVLLPGDRLTIPPIRRREESRAIDQRHRFRRKGVPEMLQMRLLDEDAKPRANLPYTLTIDRLSFTGTTNSGGELRHAIPPNARGGQLVVGVGHEIEEIPLSLGHLDPIGTTTGVQARLNNLGFECGAIDGDYGPKTRKAMKRFQAHCGLKLSGEADAQTLEALQKMHGS